MSIQTGQQQKKDTLVKVVYTCPMHSEVVQDKPGKCPKCKMNLVKKEVPTVVYTCPMHPEVIKDKPGKCPKCKMNLVKKEEPKKK
jgi:Cu(I)/Ag(I) efflux system membrane fusion protein